MKKVKEESVKFAAYSGGILFLFLLYGVMQEKLMTTAYNGKVFNDTAFIVFINRVIAAGLAMFMLSHRNEYIKPVAPITNYAFISFSNFLSTFCQYEALKYVTFPTQTLGKSAKMIPVLLIGTFIQRKRYPGFEYIVAVVVMAGCSLFLTGGTYSAKNSSEHDSPFGFVLILIYLLFDGFTSTTQERLFNQYKASTYNQMLYVNGISSVVSLMTVIFRGGITKLSEDVTFSYSNPVFMRDALIISFCSSLGQVLIYHFIQDFGALLYSTVMTTRQFFSVFLSNLLFSHRITASQWVAAVMVIGALWVKMINKVRMKTTKVADAVKLEQVEIILEKTNLSTKC